MTAIRSGDSLKYGTRLVALLFGVLIVGGGILGLGLALGYGEAADLIGSGTLGTVDTTDLAGGAILSLAGSFVLLAGIVGVLHKLIADSVAAGMTSSEAVEATASSAGDADPAGDAPGESAPAATTDTAPAEQTPERPEGPETAHGGPADSAATPARTAQESSGQGKPASGAQATDAPAAGADSDAGEPSRDQPGESTGETATVGRDGSESEPAVSPSADADDRDVESESQSEFTEEMEWGGETTTPDETATSKVSDAEESPMEPSPEEIAFGTEAQPDDGSDEDAEAPEDVTTGDAVDPAGTSASKDPLAERNDDE